MCHQTVGLVAREIEAAGIATLTMSVAWDISAQVRPPRTAFVNYPMGNTAGRPGRGDEQRNIVRAALAAAQSMKSPGDIVDLGIELAEPAPDGGPWQDWVYTPEYRSHFMKRRDGGSWGTGTGS